MFPYRLSFFLEAGNAFVYIPDFVETIKEKVFNDFAVDFIDRGFETFFKCLFSQAQHRCAGVVEPFGDFVPLGLFGDFLDQAHVIGAFGIYGFTGKNKVSGVLSAHDAGKSRASQRREKR